jgi:hypothetical protein
VRGVGLLLLVLSAGINASPLDSSILPLLLSCQLLPPTPTYPLPPSSSVADIECIFSRVSVSKSSVIGDVVTPFSTKRKKVLSHVALTDQLPALGPRVRLY